jgi:Fibronectin type III domain
MATLVASFAACGGTLGEMRIDGGGSGGGSAITGGAGGGGTPLAAGGGSATQGGGQGGGTAGGSTETPDAGPGAPMLSDITVSVTDTSVTVSWKIDQPSSGQFDYGTTKAYGMSSVADSTFTRVQHVQTVNGLTAGTTYHLRVRSSNAALQETASSDIVFVTTGGQADAGTKPDAGAAPQEFATTLSGFGNFISGSPGFADSSGLNRINLGGFQPVHPSVGQYNADGTLLATHSGPFYRTNDGAQAGSFLDLSQVRLKQWSNVDPNKLYYLTNNDCSTETTAGQKAQLFSLDSARKFFGINFDKFWATDTEGSFIVGPDQAIVIFGVQGTQARALVWKIGSGWLPSTYVMPETFTSSGWDLSITTPIGDPLVPDNIGYVYVKPIPQGGSDASWAIISITSKGATSRTTSRAGGTHHASQCVWQDSDGSFRPGLVDAAGRVIAGDGSYFSFPFGGGILWHVGWVRGTIFASGDKIENGSNVGASAFALRKTNQGGYQVLGSGTNGGYPGFYAKNGVVNANCKDPSSNRVIMLRR